MEPHVDDIEVVPVPVFHDLYYEIRDGVPVLSTEKP